jgi:hypothetical protein
MGIIGAGPWSHRGTADGGVPAGEQGHRQHGKQPGQPGGGQAGEEVADTSPAVRPGDDKRGREQDGDLGGDERERAD